MSIEYNNKNNELLFKLANIKETLQQLLLALADESYTPTSDIQNLKNQLIDIVRDVATNKGMECKNHFDFMQEFINKLTIKVVDCINTDINNLKPLVRSVLWQCFQSVLCSLEYTPVEIMCAEEFGGKPKSAKKIASKSTKKTTTKTKSVKKITSKSTKKTIAKPKSVKKITSKSTKKTTAKPKSVKKITSKTTKPKKTVTKRSVKK